MKKYLRERAREAHNAKMIGITLAIVLHAGLCLVGSFKGIKYIYPPPEEKTLLIEFDDLPEPEPIQYRRGRQPSAANADKTKPIELVKQSEAQMVGHKQNEAKEATVGPDGDVEVPEPPREKPIDRRALFHAADNKTDKDTLAPQTAAEISDKLSSGHADGNTKHGKTTGQPNARVVGRSVVGNLPSPAFTVQESGVVVVSIWVDQYGNVNKAVAGAEGTTVADKSLWNEARKAALNSHFNVSANAPALQQGTITYIFDLK